MKVQYTPLKSAAQLELVHVHVIAPYLVKFPSSTLSLVWFPILFTLLLVKNWWCAKNRYNALARQQCALFRSLFMEGHTLGEEQTLGELTYSVKTEVSSLMS